jgi:hypothetical protein
VRSGAFAVADALSLAQLAAGDAAVLPPLRALDSLPRERLADDEVQRIARGQEIAARVGGDRAALVNAGGALVALAERRGDRWQPRVVMHRV